MGHIPHQFPKLAPNSISKSYIQKMRAAKAMMERMAEEIAMALAEEEEEEDVVAGGAPMH